MRKLVEDSGPNSKSPKRSGSEGGRKGEKVKRIAAQSANMTIDGEERGVVLAVETRIYENATGGQ